MEGRADLSALNVSQARPAQGSHLTQTLLGYSLFLADFPKLSANLKNFFLINL